MNLNAWPLSKKTIKFRMACQLVSEEEIEGRRMEVEQMWESGENPFVKALRNH